MDVKELQKKIIQPSTYEELCASGLTEEEARIFSNYKLFPIDLLVKADWNYKKENEALSEKLLANLKRNGQIENIHVRLLDTGFYEVVNGNHRLDKAKELGSKFMYAYDHGKVSREEAIRKAIETNETKFSADIVELSARMKELQESGMDIDELLATMPYSEEELDDFMNMSEFDWADYEDGDADDVNDPTMKTIKLTVPTNVHEQWMAWQERVNRILGYDSDWKAFEFAVAEAMNIPEESLET